jgi:cytochrome c oxidase assembly factor CtaG
VAIALISPLDEMSGALFSAHMTQHLMLGLVAPLLLVAGQPLRTLEHGLPRAMASGARVWRRRLHLARVRRRVIALALAAIAAHVGAFWLWHIPALYDAAIAHPALHALEHLTLLATGLLFWAVIGRARWHHQTGLAVLVLFVAGLGSGALAALLTLAPRPLYEAHATTTAAWHLTPLEDQQLAGALMWVPGGLVYAITAVVLFVQWLEAGPGTVRYSSTATATTTPTTPTVHVPSGNGRLP